MVSSLSPAQQVELNSLRARLSHRLGEQLELRAVLGHIRSLKDRLQNLERVDKARRLSEWRQEMIASDTALSRWLKSKTNLVGVSVASEAGAVAETDVEAAETIRRYWQTFWAAAGAAQPALQNRVQSILGGVAALPQQDWAPPSGAVLAEVAKGGKGSAGPDGWSGPELSALPVDVFDTFALLGSRWLDMGGAPSQFLESRMICLPKGGKGSADHVIGVQDTRPITILSAWWRARRAA